MVGGEIVSNRYLVHEPRLLLFLCIAHTMTTIATAAMMNFRSNWSDNRTPITEILPQTYIVCQTRLLVSSVFSRWSHCDHAWFAVAASDGCLRFTTLTPSRQCSSTSTSAHSIRGDR